MFKLNRLVSFYSIFFVPSEFVTFSRILEPCCVVCLIIHDEGDILKYIISCLPLTLTTRQSTASSIC